MTCLQIDTPIIVDNVEVIALDANQLVFHYAASYWPMSLILLLLFFFINISVVQVQLCFCLSCRLENVFCIPVIFVRRPKWRSIRNSGTTKSTQFIWTPHTYQINMTFLRNPTASHRYWKAVASSERKLPAHLANASICVVRIKLVKKKYGYESHKNST